MTQPDLQERLHSLGYDQPDSTLKQHLHYYQLSPWPPLDTAAGGQRLLKEALNVNAQLVVIDTLIRTVEGEENSADTIKNFSRYTAVPLKAAGIALLRIDHAGKDLTRGQRGTSAKRDNVDVVWLLKPASGNLPGKTMLTLKREAARVDWIQEDIHITRDEGPPLAHTIPSFSELTSADFAIVHYLQEQGLWRHNITIRSARAALNRSTLMAKTQRLNNIVKWVKQYSDTHSESGDHPGAHTLSSRGDRGGDHNTEKGNTQVSEGDREGIAENEGDQGKGTIPPPIGGGMVPPQTPSKPSKTANYPSHGKNPRDTTSWVAAPAAPATAKNTTLPPSFPAPKKSLATATRDLTSNGAAATSKPNTAPTDLPLSIDGCVTCRFWTSWTPYAGAHAGAHARGVIFFTRPGPGSGAREEGWLSRLRAYWRYGSARESH